MASYISTSLCNFLIQTLEKKFKKNKMHKTRNADIYLNILYLITAFK